MLGACSDPVSGEPVGSRPRAPAGGAPVAGFDLTFSISKSISVMWALGDDETRNVIEKCHRQAIEFVISYAEREVFCSRSGTNGIVSEDITGVIAASFTHFTSRADDCQLHDHLVVWNRARSVSDGKWRTLDSRAIFKATTTLSELHQGVLSDLLTAELGVGWEARGRRHSTKPRYEITGVPESLMAEFSQRSEQIAARGDELNSSFVDAHGRRPTVVEDDASPASCHDRHPAAEDPPEPRRADVHLARAGSRSRVRGRATGVGLEPRRPQRPAAPAHRRPRRADPRRRRSGGGHDGGRAPLHLRSPESFGRGSPAVARGPLRLSR